jgi:Mannosylglycerate hydrolase MGH1-like glycoside hydrolase domain
MNTFSDDPSLKNLRQELGLQEQLMQRGIFTDADTGRAYFTGYSYRTLYDWDQYFEAIVQIYMGWPSDTIKNGVTIFLDHQHPTGLISRSVPSNAYHDPEHVKPFLSQIALLVYRNYGELDWIASKEYFPRLQRYLDYWLVEMDANHNGLSEWMSAPHTGMDNQHERAGWWLDRFSEGVDLNCYLVRECRAFARLAELAGRGGLSQEYNCKADDLAARIRQVMWDESEGFYYDHNARSGEALMSRHAGWASTINGQPVELIRVKSASAFAVLWAGIATPDQARRMVFEHLFNSREFWTPYPVAALSKSERWYSQDWLPGDLGCNWRAKTWVPINYMVAHGLNHYGYTDLAELVADRTFRLVKEAGDREYYDAETGQGCGLDPFWGWSLLGHFMRYETTCAQDITCLEDSG